MGSWDTYCAICGGPFRQITFMKRRAGQQDQEGGQEESVSEDEGEGEEQQDQMQVDFDGESTSGDDSGDGDFELDEDDQDSLLGDEGDESESEESETEYEGIEVSDVEEEGEEEEEEEDDTPEQNLDIDTEGLLTETEGGEQEEEEEGNSWDLDPQELNALLSEARSGGYDDTASDMNEEEEFGYETDRSDGGGVWGSRYEDNYDPAVIRPKDTKWKDALFVLGFNREVGGKSKCYLSGRGRSIEYGCARFWPGLRGRRDANYPRTKGKRLQLDWVPLYRVHDESEEKKDDLVHFPVHMPCLELLCGHITGLASPYNNRKLDKDALYLAMLSLTEGAHHSLMIAYGAAEAAQDQYWVSRAGNEFLVANPRVNRDQLGVLDLLKRVIGEAAPREFVTADLGHKVRQDPFTKLPYDLVYRVSNLLDDECLLKLCTASWPVHCHLRGNNKFWRHRLRRVSMPWFDEVMPTLADKTVMGERKDWKSVLCELNKVVVGDEGEKGMLMGVMNRRRIWGMCKMIGRRYYEMVEKRKVKGSEEIMREVKDAYDGM
ncbi:hypothetical protein QBC44DRAFT_385301 [Cladorrhinum sp. PSN332]|nr:hypothetical protein QBC44DRAFT_385301 [Cladorrhinum sp. PSN332]